MKPIHPVFDRRRLAALRHLEAAGIWRAHYLPPALRLFWWMGLPARPPHFAGFGWNALGSGVFFAALYTPLMWFFQWRGTPGGLLIGVPAGLLAGVLFGLTMAGYLAYVRRKHTLPRWEQLDGEIHDA